MDQITVPVSDEFANHIARWHVQNLLQLQHIIDTPDDVAIEVTDNDTGEARILTAEEREIFIQGVLVAKSIFAALPFRTTTLQVVEDEPAQVQAKEPSVDA